MDIAVVLVNYNSTAYTLKCVESIFRHTSQDLRYRIFIVDNNSQSDEIRRLTELSSHPKVTLFFNKTNQGLSSAHMLAVGQIHARYVYFLNNDCEILNDCLGILMRFMDQTPDAGLCSGQMYGPDGSLSTSFRYVPSLALHLFGTGFLRLFAPHRYPKKGVLYSAPVKVEAVTGASLFVDFKKFMDSGGFDTRYFLYCEEEDLALTLKKRAHKVYLVPEAKFVHHSGKSTGRSYTFEREYYISLFTFFRKHYSKPECLVLRFFYVLKLLARALRRPMCVKLAFFVLAGASEKHSLRHQQKPCTVQRISV